MSGETQPQARRLRVFLSYSRHDKEFARALRDRLIVDGFDAFLDVHDIVKGEPWQERLQKLIGSADAILFLITPAAVRSEYCQWEVNEAERLGKRIFPVVALETPLQDIPGRLQRLNFSILDLPANMALEYPRLLEALRQDAVWVREHTRLLEVATRWSDAERPARLLLRGRDISAGEGWRDSRAPTALALSPLHAEYLNASRRHASRVLRYWIAGLAGVILSVSVLAVVAIRQRDAAIEQRLAAESSEGALRSDAVRESAPEQALAYALAAFDKKPLAAALGAVRRSIDRTILLRVRDGATRFESAGGGRSAQWARSRDGTRIVIGQEPGMLLLLDGETLDEKKRLQLPKVSPTAIAISTHGRYVASADGSPRVTFWTADSGRRAEIIAPHDVRSIVFGPAERRVALIGWDAITFFGLQPLARLSMATKSISGAHALDFAPDDSLVAAVGRRNEAWIIDPATAVDRSGFDMKAEAAQLKPSLGGSAASMLERPKFIDGTKVLVTGWHLCWSLWDAGSGKRIAQAQMLTPGMGSGWALVNPALDTVVTEEGTSGRIAGWSLSTGERTHDFGPGHRDLIRAAALSRDGGTVATIGGDHNLTLWNVADPRRLGSWRASGRNVVEAAFTPSGNRVVTLTSAGELALWDARAVVQSGSLAREGADDSRSFYEPQLSTDGTRLVSFGGSAAVTVWDVSRLEPLCVSQGLGEVRHAALSDDGKLVATAGADGFLRIWQVAGCREMTRHAGKFTHVAFNAAADAVVANDYGGLVRVIAVADGRLISEGRFSQNLTNAAVFTRDGSKYALLGNDGSAILVATSSGRELARIRLDGMPFRRAIFTADAARLLTTHDDNVVRSWDVSTGRLLAQLPGAAGAVPRLRLLADDQLVLAPSHDGTTRLWNVADGSLVRTFEGTSVEASDAVFAGDHVTVINSEGRGTLHRCEACLAEQTLIARARKRIRALKPAA